MLYVCIRKCFKAVRISIFESPASKCTTSFHTPSFMRPSEKEFKDVDSAVLKRFQMHTYNIKKNTFWSVEGTTGSGRRKKMSLFKHFVGTHNFGPTILFSAGGSGVDKPKHNLRHHHQQPLPVDPPTYPTATIIFLIGATRHQDSMLGGGSRWVCRWIDW